MTFRPPSKIVQKIMRFRSIQYKDGRVTLWGIPALFSPNYVRVYEQRLMESQLTPQKAAAMIYAIGRLQGEQGTKFLTDRFGYAETIRDKAELLKFISGQTEMVGIGQFEWVRMDFKNNHFIIKGFSPFAEEYTLFFGKQKIPIDYFLRGLFAGGIEALINKDLFCIETSCYAQGKRNCEFVIKPIKAFNKGNPRIKQQMVKILKDIMKLGAQREPYLARRT